MTVAVLLWAGLAQAQTISRVSLSPADPPRWDVSGEAGWLSSNKSDIAPPWDEWYDQASGGAGVGYYWTPHLRSELRLAFSGEGRVYEELRTVVPGQPFPTFRLRDHFYRTTTAGGGVSYQFFENQWFHPSLGGGLELVRESQRDSDGGRGVSWDARSFVSGGFKWYVNERGFTRSDVRVWFSSSGVSHVTWTAGIGVDL